MSNKAHSSLIPHQSDVSQHRFGLFREDLILQPPTSAMFPQVVEFKNTPDDWKELVTYNYFLRNSTSTANPGKAGEHLCLPEPSSVTTTTCHIWN